MLWVKLRPDIALDIRFCAKKDLVSLVFSLAVAAHTGRLGAVRIKQSRQKASRCKNTFPAMLY